MDLRYNHGGDIHVVRANCDDAPDLIAIGGEHSVQVLLTTATSIRVIADFYIGCRITAVAWSTRCTSPSTTDEWSIELAAAGSNFGLYQLTKSHSAEEDVFPFGGGLSGHHGRVNDMAFCGGHSEDSWRYVATVSDDKMLMVWDLNPSVNIASPPDRDASPEPRPQPTAYVISFPFPLTTVAAHPSTSKEFLIADARGNIFLTDWRTDPEENELVSWRNSSVIELVEPRALSDAVCGSPGRWAGCVAWRRDSADIIGAAYGSRFALWDLSKLQGGKPNAVGPTFPDGGTKFRWCATFPDYFAVTTNSTAKGAVVHVYNTGYLQAQPTVFAIAPRPLYVRDFDFVGGKGIPRIAAAVGRELVIFYIGVES